MILSRSHRKKQETKALFLHPLNSYKTIQNVTKGGKKEEGKRETGGRGEENRKVIIKPEGMGNVGSKTKFVFCSNHPGLNREGLGMGWTQKCKAAVTSVFLK